MSPDGSTLYMSDGTAFIRVLDPKTMEEKAPRIQVHNVLDPKTLGEMAPRIQVLAAMITNIVSYLIAGWSTYHKSMRTAVLQPL
jgi:glutamine cyclotransferase